MRDFMRFNLLKWVGILLVLSANQVIAQVIYSVDFEGVTETKTAYAAGNVVLTGLSWEMANSLIGTSAQDFKNGARSARLRGHENSSMTMLADLPNVGKISFLYRRYGTDIQVDWKVEYSLDEGLTWNQAGMSFTSPANDDVQLFSADVDVDQPVRFRILRATMSGTTDRRLNIDDITFTQFGCNSESFIEETACQSYNFHGTELTTSGDYQHVLVGANAAGCDSTVNLTLTIVSGFTYYEDFDGDGLGNPNSTIEACSLPAGYVENADDCDDTDDQIGAASEVYYVDADGDGFGAGNPILFCSDPGAGYATNNDDCDDTNDTIYPGATEIPDDGIDQNCDGTDATIFGNQLAIYEFNGTLDCTIQDNEVTAQPENATFSAYSSQGTSCSNAGGVFNRSGWNTNPGIDLNRYNQFTVTADECYTLSVTKFKFDHRVSNITAVPTWYVRSSVDGYSTDLATGNSNTSVQTLEFLLGPEFQNLSEVTFRLYVSGVTANATTWRNDNVSVMGYINALPLQTYYADADGDGFGNPDVTIEWCEAPSGYVSNADDCNDDSALINPNTVWFLDNDGDGYGDNSTATTSCVQPGPDYVLAGGDCDDTNEEVNPSAPEVCNGIDDNCNGLIDAQDPDVEDADVYYVDEDEDGYGAGDPILFCSNPGPGYATVAGDCNDQDPDVNPGVSEICNGEDTDCNGLIDDGLEFTTYYVDADGDGFGAGEGIEFCADPGEGYSTVDGDCNDEDPTIYPGAEEIADDGIDQDCDGEDLSTASIAKNDWVKFDLVPNPSAGKVTVRFNQNVHDTDVTIFALTGQQVASFKVNGTSAVLNLSHFNDGVYLVRIRSDRGEHTSRLILAK
jgi:hypothetical protein